MTRRILIMKATVLDLRRRMSDVMRAIDHNESVTILYRGKEKAVLSPVNTQAHSPISIQDHPAFGTWSNHNDIEDVHDHIRRLRRGRLNVI